ncbi:hypothetical protein KTQ81_25280 [Salmonella enterica subsp. diarizonae]|uniref:hypothetical protein n=1 Tax=Salmonella enterica TaxID=28901 RepID=UPI001CF560AE|nr:hypothetical protein [Salmonella enterica subsp. diarizonae]
MMNTMTDLVTLNCRRLTETGEELASRYCDMFFRSAEPLRRAFFGIRHEVKALFAEARHSLEERRQIYHDIRLAV